VFAPRRLGGHFDFSWMDRRAARAGNTVQEGLMGPRAGRRAAGQTPVVGSAITDHIWKLTNCSLNSPEKLGYPDAQRVCNDFQRAQGHALLAGFEAIEVYPIQARGFSELILRESSFFSESRNPPTDHGLNVRLQPIRLWAYAALKHPA
jgi:hypothetical protein